jgi:hypothetical protein
VIVVVIGKMQIAGHESSGDAQRTQALDHQHRYIPTAPARERQRLYRALDSFLVPRHVLERPLDGLRHGDQKLVRVGRSVRAQEPGGPASDVWVRGQRRDTAREFRSVFRRVGKRMRSGKIRDIGGAEHDRRMVDTNGAFEAKLAGPLREAGGRDVIAEGIPRPEKLARLG